MLFPDDRSIAPIVQQLVGFGVEKHDDLADAMSMGLNYLQAHLVYEVYVSFYGSFDRDTESTKPYHAYKVRFTDEKA